MLNRVFHAAALLAALPASGFGRSLHGYGFFAPGQKRALEGPDFTMHFGGGAKCESFAAFGLGVEAAVAGPRRDFSKRSEGVVSTNIYYYLLRGQDPHHRYHGGVEPFVTSGYSRNFGNGNGFNWANLGVGIDF